MRRALDLFTVSTMDAVKSGVTEAVVSTSHSSDWYLGQSGSALKHPWASTGALCPEGSAGT